MSLSNKGLPQSFKLLARSISLKVSSVDKVSSSIGTEDEGLFVHALKKNSAQNNMDHIRYTEIDIINGITN